MTTQSNRPSPDAPATPSLGKTLVVAARVLVALTVLTGVVYPLAVTGVASALFPREARGSLIDEGGVVRGSRLLGQEWTSPRYFFGRPSATSPKAYDGTASAGSNLGPTNPALTERVRARLEALAAADRAAGGSAVNAPVPVDLVTASGSGLDPHVSPAAADAQVARVARARALSPERVRALVAANTEGRALGVLGEPVVNVLLLNLALDRESPAP
ncbi:MAG: potassium-transporting ATPase subunit KdpC [Polyangiaceae bacterium]